MEVSFTRGCSRRLALGLAALALAGCASMASRPEDAVRDRAGAYWKARIAGDFDRSYSFLPPSYRSATPVEMYKKGLGMEVQLQAAEVTGVKCESEDKCVATMKVTARHVLSRNPTPPFSLYYDEVWVSENGGWWLFPTP
jgi:hypothetical protein